MKNHIVLNNIFLMIEKKNFLKAINLLETFKPENNEDFFKKYYLLGLCFENVKKYQDSILFYSKGLRIFPNHVPSLYNVANLYTLIDKTEIAENVLKKCLQIDGNFIQATINLSSLYLKKKKYEDALSLLHKEVYNDHNLNINKLYALIELKKYTDVLKSLKLIFKKFKNISDTFKSKYLNILGIYYNYFAKYKLAIKYFTESLQLEFNSSVKTNLDGCKIFLDLNFSKSTSLNIKDNIRHQNIFNISEKKINIAFISSDFRDHVVMYQIYDFLIYFLEQFENKFNIFFFYNHNTEDVITRKIKSLSKNWYNISYMTDNEAFDLIKKLKINVMFDLMGLSKNNRMSLYKDKPCDYLVNWCGWLTSTNNSNFDFILGDKFVFENFNEKFYSEKTLVLKRLWSTISKSLINNKPLEQKTLVANSAIFICPQRFNKIYDINIKMWRDIINQKSTSKFLLVNSSYSDTRIINKLKKKFSHFDCDLNKLEFHFCKDRSSYLELFKKADIALDTFPYSGMTTSFELLLMSIPIITLKGNHFVSNTTYSLNKNLDLEECISESPEEYTNKAIELSKSENLYSDVRKRLLRKIIEEDIFDHKSFTNDFVELFANNLN